MRKLIFFTVVLASAMMVTSCEKNDEVTEISLLKRSWTHSYEEKASEGVQIYRPSEYRDFPPSWYRQVFHFDDNNVCDYLVLAPNDAHFMTSGSWEYNEKTNSIKIFNSDSKMVHEFKLIGLTDNLLKLKVKH